MNTSRAIAGALFLGLTLSSCTSPAPQAAPATSIPPAATPTATPTPTPTPSRNVNARGQIIKAAGETAGWKGNKTADTPTLTFNVTSIQPITCDAPYATPPTGTMIALDLEISTTSDFAGPLISSGQNFISFDPYHWKGYAANGTRMNTVDSGSSHNCLADRSRLLPSEISKGEQLKGLVLLDVASPSGEVSFDPFSAGGWVWSYPSP
jgi:hypothetical protein